MKKLIIVACFGLAFAMAMIWLLVSDGDNSIQAVNTDNVEEIDSLLSVDIDYILDPGNPPKEAVNFLRTMYVKELQYLRGDCPSDNVDDLTDTTGAHHTYSVEASCFCGGSFKIRATGKYPEYKNFVINSRGVLTSNLPDSVLSELIL